MVRQKGSINILEVPDSVGLAITSFIALVLNYNSDPVSVQSFVLNFMHVLSSIHIQKST